MASKADQVGRGARNINRAEIVDHNFLKFLDEWDTDSPTAPVEDSAAILSIFEAQLASRHLDLVAREMRARNEGFYTIGSSGHENNAALGYVSRLTDPAFLHYRSGAFMIARGNKNPNADPIFATALSLAASSDDPASGGRHKVWGSDDWVLPQTSTIASHLPKAFGAAVALAQVKSLGRTPPVPDDSIMICSFGDAGANHSAAQGAFNAAQWTAYQNLPVPIVFVCEDNGIGISVRTPSGWIESSFAHRPGLHYIAADGLDLVDSLSRAREAVDYCRRTRKPVFLHMKLCRLLGHAGTDVETDYLPLETVERTEASDPLLLSAETILDAGLLDRDGVRELYETTRKRVRDAAVRAATHPKLTLREEVIKPQAPYSPKLVNSEATRTDYQDKRVAIFGSENALPENGPRRHMAININRALHDLMIKYDEMTVFGEDVAQKGGVYTITKGLRRAFEGKRVFNTLLDETTIFGMAQGAGYLGMLPFPEIQYLAYVHNAADQLRGEACSLQFFSNDHYRNPMVVRIASLAYQKGFGGHFHNDNSFAALRDIPGLIIACPSRGDDAAMMLRTAAALARVDGRIVAMLEPIALYMTKDLHEDRDGAWQFAYPAPDRAIPLGQPRVYFPEAADLTIITYGNGVRFSLRAAKRLKDTFGFSIRVMDLRWLKPLNPAAIAEHAMASGKVLIVDEGRRTGGVGEQISATIAEQLGEVVKVKRISGADSYIPLAGAADLVLLSEQDIVEAAHSML